MTVYVYMYYTLLRLNKYKHCYNTCIGTLSETLSPIDYEPAVASFPGLLSQTHGVAA